MEKHINMKHGKLPKKSLPIIVTKCRRDGHNMECTSSPIVNVDRQARASQMASGFSWGSSSGGSTAPTWARGSKTLHGARRSKRRCPTRLRDPWEWTNHGESHGSGPGRGGDVQIVTGCHRW
ncbi:uncharacterized protein PgNI_08806 [Pyricularia grisea]|uniref:Uncharacterized protein n=1 Tax=Pyricularia grisea TaxID=148305 RepID=A0A6P8AUA3_PYRGI|nr:uncharacterized protein PgNI_08806 [Pyricularia grisea]TLD05744.1 hypothetical protein PgNI_08806 [Pyricularia grisea]